MYFMSSVMALNLLCFSLKSPNILNISRLMRITPSLQRLRWYSTSKNVQEGFVKFSKSEAYKTPISENLYGKKVDKPKYEHLVVLVSIASFLIYFCILREENDIDEVLKGNDEYANTYVKYVRLNSHLKYCEKNHLPTQALRQKVEELKEQLQKMKN